MIRLAVIRLAVIRLAVIRLAVIRLAVIRLEAWAVFVSVPFNSIGVKYGPFDASSAII